MAMKNDAITDMDALMDASMDDLDDLPPIGVPPTGHYNLSVSAERITPDDANKKDYIRLNYEVMGVNEVKDENQLSEVVVGQKFSQNFSPVKKNGEANTFAISLLKENVAPFAAHFGTTKMSETIQAMQSVAVAASLVRRAAKGEEERFNMTLKDVVIL